MKAEFFVFVHRGFELIPLYTEKVSGEILETNGRMLGICKFDNDETVIVYDIESGLSIAKMPAERFEVSMLFDFVKRFEKYMADNRKTDVTRREWCTEIIKIEYDKYPEIKRQVFGEVER